MQDFFFACKRLNLYNKNMHLKKILFFLTILILFVSCKSKSEKKQTQKEILLHKNATLINSWLDDFLSEQDKKLDDYISKMSLEEKIAQMFIENLEGNKEFRSYEYFSKITGNKNDDKPIIAGGYLFFAPNIADSKENQINFINSIRTYVAKNSQIQPYLAVDQEGGYVDRLKKITQKLPSQQDIARNNTPKEAFSIYENESKQMKTLGFNMNLAPVMEVCSEDNKEFLDGRSFGDLMQTKSYGISCINAYEFNDIATVIKHFPGNTNTDPHSGLPEIEDDLETLKNNLQGFYFAINENPSGKQPTGILMSHARTKAIDSQNPACLSKVWVTDILRNEFCYEGLIFSDDIFMDALAKNGFPPEIAVVMAVDAGVNCIMTSQKRFSSQAKILYDKAKNNNELTEKINNSVKRILKYKISANLFSLD